MHVNDFPTEILEEIFLRSISDSQKHSHVPPFTTCSGSPAIACVISKICKRWKDIALNFAPLWTHLHVEDPQDVSIVQDLQVWMHRAGTLPLCFSFRQLEYHYHPEACAAVVTFFLNSLQRCQSFEVFVTNSNLKQFGLENFEITPSISLQSVNVWCRDRLGWDDAKLLTNLFLNTRSLRTIRWSCVLHCPQAIIPHPWENLRELTTSSVGIPAEFLNALSHCKNLERLAIHNASYDVGLPSKAISVTLPRVTHLTKLFRSVDHDETISILTPLVLPSLVELELVLWDTLTIWTPILDLLQRSGVALRKLGIIRNGTSSYSCPNLLYQHEFIRILKMPYFQELRVLEVEEFMMSGCGVARFLTLPPKSNTVTAWNEENGETSESGYLVHLERLCLVFQDTGAANLSRYLKSLVVSRLGRMSNPGIAKWHIETKEQIMIHFSFSTSPTFS